MRRGLWSPVLLLSVGLVSGWPFAGSLPGVVGPESHCVIEVIDQKASGELVTSKLRCYPSFAQAMADASQDRLRLPADTRGDIVFTDPGVAAVVASFTLGVHYDGFGGSGSSVAVVGDSCSGGWWNTGSGWANRISSTYNGCQRLRHYDYPDKGGIWEDTFGAGTIDNLSTVNNMSESVSYHSS